MHGGIPGGAKGSYLCCWCWPGRAAGHAGCPPAWSGPSAAGSASASSSCAAPGRRDPVGPARWRTPESPWRPSAAPSPARNRSRSLREQRGATDSCRRAVPSPPRDPQLCLSIPRDQIPPHPGTGPLLGAHHQGCDLGLGHSQVAELLFSLVSNTGGRKHSLICNPIAPSAFLMRSAGRTAGARHRGSPEPSSDVGQEASTPPNILRKFHRTPLGAGARLRGRH